MLKDTSKEQSSESIYCKTSLSLKKRLAKYELFSVIKALVKRFHSPANRDNPGSHMHFINSIGFDWAFEVCEVDQGEIISDTQLLTFLNQIWDLQFHALNLNEKTYYGLSLRPYLLQQLSYQRNFYHEYYSVVRIYTVVLQGQQRKRLEQQFLSTTGLELAIFMEISVFLMLRLGVTEDKACSYEFLLSSLYPQFSPDTLVKYLRYIGCSIIDIKQKYKDEPSSPQNRRDYFRVSSTLTTPLILDVKHLLIINKNLMCGGLKNKLLDGLVGNRDDKRNKIFTDLYELYIGQIIKEYNHPFIDEKQIKSRLFKNNMSGEKNCDFIIFEKDCTIAIEAKGIEPNELVLLSDDELILRDKLKPIFSAVIQSTNTLDKLEKLNDGQLAPKSQRFAIIVTLGNFGFHHPYVQFKGSPALLKSFNEKCSEGVLSKHVFICSASEFELLCSTAVECGCLISDIFQFSVDKHDEPREQTFEMLQLIEQFVKQYTDDETATPFNSRTLIDQHISLFKPLDTKIKNNHAQWAKAKDNVAIVMFQKVNAFKKELFGE
jgi:hypothetical protein